MACPCSLSGRFSNLERRFSSVERIVAVSLGTLLGLSESEAGWCQVGLLDFGDTRLVREQDVDTSTIK